MSYAALLINTGTVRRYTAGAGDDYGRPAKTWADHLTDQPCRLMPISGPAAEIRVGAEVVIAEYKLFCNDIDVTEQDRWLIDSVTYEVLLVKPIQDGVDEHHKECYLRTVR